MAKVSSINRNLKREKMVRKFARRRQALKDVIMNKQSTPEEVFEAMIKLSELPRNSSKVRVHNRCALTGRSRGYYRKLKMSRIKLRELANEGMIPGMVKSSW